MAEVHADLPADLVGQLSEVAARSGAALHHAVLATVFAALADMAGEDRVGVIVPFANRESADAAGLVADTANCLPLVVDLRHCPDTTALVSQVRVQTLRALASQRLSASEIARRLRPDDFHGIPRRPYVLVNFVADDAYTAATNPELPDTSVAPWTRA